MTAPTVAASGWLTDDLTSGESGSGTRAAVASSKSAVAIVTAAQGGNDPAPFLNSGGFITYGNEPLIKIPGASAVAVNTIGTTRHRRVEFFWLEDISGRDDDVFRYQAPSDASSWTISLAVLNHTGPIGILDVDTFVQDGGSGTGAADSDVILDPGSFDALGLVASMCDNTVTNKTSQSTITSMFFGVHHAMSSIRNSISGGVTLGHNRAFDGGPWVAGGVLFGSGNVTFEPEGADYVYESGGTQITSGGVAEIPVPGVDYKWEGGGEDVQLIASTDWQVRLANLEGTETPVETEGGDEGDVLTRHPGRKPTWDPIGASTHPDLETHDELGLATDAELAAHVDDTTDAHEAAAIAFAPAGTLSSTNVQDAIEEVSAEASLPIAFRKYLQDNWR